MPNFFPRPDASNCDVPGCHPTCLTCEASGANFCHSCHPNAKLGGSAPNQCVCMAGFTPSNDAANCLNLNCHTMCSNCTGPGAHECTHCWAYAGLVGSSPNSCECFTGFYLDKDTSRCKACHPTCTSCDGPGIASCLSCHPGAQCSGSAPNTCVCQPGLFPSPDATYCTSLMCHKSCKRCSGSSAAQCLECYDNAYLQGASPNQCVCESGWYAHENNAGDCRKCHSSCVTCGGGTINHCLSCGKNAFINGGGMGACECYFGYYMAPDAALCLLEDCHATC
jgi:proprotein convertase subtilisin/kexin type 5